MNKITNTKVGQINNSLKLKARRLKQWVISRFQFLIIYMHKNIMINKNNKGQGEKNNSVVRRPKIGEMARKVAMAGFVVAAMGVWFFAGANGADAAFSCDKFQIYA